MTAADRTPTATGEWSARLDRAIDGDGVHADFQPIVDLQHHQIVGYEARIRFTVDGVDEGVDAGDATEWFRHAHDLGRGAQLEARTMAATFAHRPELPKNCFLSLNVDPDHLTDHAVREVLGGQGNLGGVVIELTEHHPWELPALLPALRLLRGDGATIAIDHAGAGYAGLLRVLELRPSFLKLDRSLVHGVHQDEAKVALIEMIGVFASRIDAWVLADGVEKLVDAQRLMDLDVPLAQGPLFGRPSPPWLILDDPLADLLRRVDQTYVAELERLVDPVPPIPDGQVDLDGWMDIASAWRAVLDVAGRPTGLVHASSMTGQELIETLIANVHATPQQVAQRLSTGVAEPGAPVIVTDDRGDYLGLVTIRRLLSELGDDLRW